MAQKILSIHENSKLTIESGKTLTFRDSVYIPPVKKVFAPSPLKENFEEFVPQLTLDKTAGNIVIKINNISNLVTYLSSAEYEEKYYTDYLETGIILIKHTRHKRLRNHRRNKLYEKLGLPKGARILWNKTTYGRSLNGTVFDEHLPVGRLDFRVDLETGKIMFIDYLRVDEDDSWSWEQHGNETDEALIFSKIHPVASRLTSEQAYLYRAQDKNHNYYFYGVVFRLKKRSYIKTSDGDGFVIGKSSELFIPVTFDVNTEQLFVLNPSSSDKFKELIEE